MYLPYLTKIKLPVGYYPDESWWDLHKNPKDPEARLPTGWNSTIWNWEKKIKLLTFTPDLTFNVSKLKNYLDLRIAATKSDK